jgi:hypothetical protein
MSSTASRPRSANCGNCRNGIGMPAGSTIRPSSFSAAAIADDMSNSPVRARPQSRAATLAVSPTIVMDCLPRGPTSPRATSPMWSPTPTPATIDISLRHAVEKVSSVGRESSVLAYIDLEHGRIAGPLDLLVLNRPRVLVVAELAIVQAASRTDCRCCATSAVGSIL